MLEGLVWFRPFFPLSLRWFCLPALVWVVLVYNLRVFFSVLAEWADFPQCLAFVFS